MVYVFCDFDLVVVVIVDFYEYFYFKCFCVLCEFVDKCVCFWNYEVVCVGVFDGVICGIEVDCVYIVCLEFCED